MVIIDTQCCQVSNFCYFFSGLMVVLGMFWCFLIGCGMMMGENLTHSTATTYHSNAQPGTCKGTIIGRNTHSVHIIVSQLLTHARSKIGNHRTSCEYYDIVSALTTENERKYIKLQRNTNNVIESISERQALARDLQNMIEKFVLSRQQDMERVTKTDENYKIEYIGDLNQASTPQLIEQMNQLYPSNKNKNKRLIEHLVGLNPVSRYNPKYAKHLPNYHQYTTKNVVNCQHNQFWDRETNFFV